MQANLHLGSLLDLSTPLVRPIITPHTLAHLTRHYLRELCILNQSSPCGLTTCSIAPKAPLYSLSITPAWIIAPERKSELPTQIRPMTSSGVSTVSSKPTRYEPTERFKNAPDPSFLNHCSILAAVLCLVLSKSMVPGAVYVRTRFRVRSTPQGWIWWVTERRLVMILRNTASSPGGIV